MKRLLLFLITSFVYAGLWAGVRAPLDAEGHTLPTVDHVGAYPCNLDSVTGTTAVLCGSTVPTGGAVIVYGVMYSTDVATSYVVFRDTSIANLISATAAIVQLWPANTVNAGSKTQVIKFPVPIRFNYGCSVNQNASPGTQPAIITIFYRPYQATE